MIRFSGLLVFLAFLAACAPTGYTPPVSIPDAAARLDVAQAEYAQVAAASTQQTASLTAVAQGTRDAAAYMATGTAVAATQTWQATADSLTIQQTVAAMAATSTADAIAANATGTAVGQAAIIEAQLVSDEATRIAIQRDAERAQLAYQRRMNAMRPWLWATAVGALALAAAGFVYRLWAISQPVRNAAGDIIALPTNQFQIMPSRMLPRGTDDPLLLPPGDDMEPVTLPAITRGHVLIAATSGSGKTIALRELVDMRAGAMVVLDPHYTPGAWGAARVVYGAEMGPYLESLERELEQRKQMRHDGQRRFEPFTVATEEMPALVGELGRDILLVWKRIMREGRKFGIFMMVVSQSTRVKSLGIDGEGDLLDNFDHVLWLGKNAAAAHPELTAGMERPAVIRSGHQPPRPVVIPYDPRKDSESEQFVPFYPFNNANDAGQVDPLIVPPPVSNLPAPEREPGPSPIDTRWGVITSQQVEQITQMYRQGYSQRAIELDVFGHVGGAAYHKVNFVLEGATTATGGRFSGVE